MGTTISDAPRHSSAARDDKLPVSKAGAKGHHNLVDLLTASSAVTLTALRAIDGADDVLDGTILLVIGRAAAGDCEPFYVAWDADNSGTDDSATIFRPTVGDASTGDGRWVRQHANPLQTFADSDATPSIASGAYFVTADTPPAAITDFDNAHENQFFVVERGAADQVITHNASLIDCGGSDVTLTADSPRASFLHVNGVHRLIGKSDLAMPAPLDALTALPLRPQLKLGADPTTGLWAGADGSGNPVVAVVVRGVPAFLFYRPQGLSNDDKHHYRFGAPPGALESLSAPVLHIAGDTDRPKLATRGIFMLELGDTSDLARRFADGDAPYDGPARPYDDEVAGKDMGFDYYQALAERAYAPGTYTFVEEHKTAGPIFLAGAAGVFTGAHRQILFSTAVSGYQDGKRYHVRLPAAAASGANPTINLNGWGAKNLKRNSGATPATDYWTAGAELTLVYNLSADELRAENDYGTDSGGAGRTTDAGYPFYGRSAGFNAHLMCNPATNNKAGMWEVMTCRPYEIQNIPRAWFSTVGMSVFGGYTVYEDGSNGHGWYNDEAYPGEALPKPNPARNRKGDFGGPVNSTVVQGWANVSIPASDAARIPALGIRQATAMDEGMDVACDYGNNRIAFRGVKQGAAINISDIEDDGYGCALVTTASPHGLRPIQTVRIAGTTPGTGVYAAAAGDPDGDGFYDGVWTAMAVSATQFLLLGSVFKDFTPHNVGTAAPAASTTWGDFNWDDGTWRFGNSLVVSPRVSLVNYLDIVGAGTGNPVTVSAKGSDTNVSLYLESQGTGTIRLRPGGVQAVRVNYTANGVNFFEIEPGAAGAPPRLRAQGADTDVDLRLGGQGAGLLRFGAHAALSGETVTGFITVKDDAGNTRKLAVVS